MNSMLQNHFIWNKASEINKNFFWYFYWNCLLFYSIWLLKILNQKATVSKETIEFVIGMATILSDIKPRSTTGITIIGYSVRRHFKTRHWLFIVSNWLVAIWSVRMPTMWSILDIDSGCITLCVTSLFTLDEHFVNFVSWFLLAIS